MRLLLVENEPDHADLVRAQLAVAFAGEAEVQLCATLQEAIRQAQGNPFDVALLDLNLADSHGLATVERFAAELPELPIVVLTSLDDEATSARGVRAGAQDYLVKDRLTADMVRRSVRHAIELKRIFVELEHINRDLGNFAHTLAHEIRSPLTTLSFAARLLEETHDIDAIPRHVERIRGAVEEIEALLSGVLDFAQGSGDEELEPVDLRRLMHEVLSSLEAEVHVAKAEINVGELPTVTSAPLKLRMLFRNLIGNSIRYRDPSRRVRIDVESQRRDKEWEVRVSDNGIGMDETDRACAFEVFKRGRFQRDQSGTGLGLALCRRIVESHGGKIWIVSAPGDGTSVHLTLPHTTP